MSVTPTPTPAIPAPPPSSSLAAKLGLVVAIVFVFVAFVAANIIASRVLRPVRFDATEGKQFTLTQGSKNIAKSPKEPVTLTLYYSAKLAQGQPALQTYAKRVRELLEEYARVSEGKVQLTVVDPEPFSEQEDQAVQAGLRPVPLPSGESIYFGLVGTNTIDTREVVPVFDMSRERFLEYDTSKLIAKLASPEKQTLAWISPLQLEGGYTFDPRTRQPVPLRQWQVMDELKTLYNVKNLNPAEVTEIPGDVQILLVVHPKALEERVQYAIDQFVLRGGRLILMLDPLCESDQAQAMPGAAPGSASNLPRLLAAWGLEMPDDRVAADQDIALRVMMGDRANPQQVPYVAWLELGPEQIDAKDAVTGQVRRITCASSGHFTPLKDYKGGVTAAPLLTTTARANTLPSSMLGQMADPKKIFAEFVPGKEKLNLAMRLTGKATTAFPEGSPKGGDAQPLVEPAKHRSESEGDIHVLLFADADILADNMWVREFNLLGTRGVQKFADNGDLVQAAVDNFAGSTDLIELRARQEAARPFTKVQEMQRLAEQQYQKEEVRLNTKLQEISQRLQQLEGQKGDDATGGLVLTPEQRAEVEKARAEMVGTRKELRQVQLNLRRDIEKLGGKLRLLNTLLVPAAVVIVAIIIAFIRATDRKAARASHARSRTSESSS